MREGDKTCLTEQGLLFIFVIFYNVVPFTSYLRFHVFGTVTYRYSDPEKYEFDTNIVRFCVTPFRWFVQFFLVFFAFEEPMSDVCEIHTCIWVRQYLTVTVWAYFFRQEQVGCGATTAIKRFSNGKFADFT